MTYDWYSDSFSLKTLTQVPILTTHVPKVSYHPFARSLRFPNIALVGNRSLHELNIVLHYTTVRFDLLSFIRTCISATVLGHVVIFGEANRYYRRLIGTRKRYIKS